MHTPLIRLILFLPLAALSGAAAPPPPNVILIVSDNQGWGDLGCFGSREVVSPHLDRMAAEGVKATSFYVTSGECTPSRGSIFTGQYPQRNGMTTTIYNELDGHHIPYTPTEYAVSPEMTLGLDRRNYTIGQMMKGAGYATGAIGKWDTGRAFRYRPLQRGYDFFYGFLTSGIDYWSGERYGIPSMYRNNDLEIPHGFSEELFTREALGFIQRNARHPFFLYVAYHTPAGNASLTTKSRRVPKKYLDLYPQRSGAIPEKIPALSGKDNRTEYLATISCMDEGIGQIMDLLKEEGIDRNTLLIFFPDNGWGPPGGDPGPFKNSKGPQDNRLGEGGIRTCFIARWPGVLPAGGTCGKFISALDILPTLAAATGARVRANDILDGFDLVPVLQAKIPSPRKEMFWQTRDDDRAARVGDYKWAQTRYYHGLYDLSKDPGETHDLSGEHPEIAVLIKSRWDNWRRMMDQTEPRGPYRDY